MLPSFILSLREGLEAALVIGIVVGALTKAGRSELRASVWRGVVAAILFSAALAVGLDLLGTEFEGPLEKIFEGTSMFLAAGLLTWMIFWVSRQNRTLKSRLESGVSRAISTTGAPALFMLSFVAVVREGVELAIFLFAARLASDTLQTLIGAILGLAMAAILGWLLVTSSRRLNLRRFFQFSNLILMFFAAGLVAHGAREFIELGWLPVVKAPIWNLNPVLSDQSFPGQVLSALFGYNGAPSLTEALLYFTYFAILGLALQFTLRTTATKTDAA